MMNCPEFSGLSGFKSFTTLYLVCLFLVGHTEVIRLSGKCLHLLSHNSPAQCQVGLFCFVLNQHFRYLLSRSWCCFSALLGPEREAVFHSVSHYHPPAWNMLLQTDGQPLYLRLLLLLVEALMTQTQRFIDTARALEKSSSFKDQGTVRLGAGAQAGRREGRICICCTLMLAISVLATAESK